MVLDAPRLAAAASDWADASDDVAVSDIEGMVSPFAESDVLRHVSADAVRVEGIDPLLELYRSGERFWLVDERWGLCELNLLKRSWRSWILADTPLDDRALFEASVLWPVAQLCRGRGLHLIPASAVGRDGRGVLILSPFDVKPELDALAGRGVGVIGRRWVCLRELAGGDVTLLSPTRPSTPFACRLVLVVVVEPMRRQQASVRPINATVGRETIKERWPLPLLGGGGVNRLAAVLARSCAVHRVRLGRSGDDLASMLVRPAAAPVRRAA